MNVIVKLSLAEVRGITKYLKETSSDINENVNRSDIEQFINGVINGELQAVHSAVADYVRTEEKKLNDSGLFKLPEMA